MKFRLVENRVIQEALSDSIPDWLKPAAINSFKYADFNATGAARNRAPMYFYRKSKDPILGSDYGRPPKGTWKDAQKKDQSYLDRGIDLKSTLARGQVFYGRGLEYDSLGSALANSNISFATAEFKKAEPPKKGTDPLLNSEDYQSFILLEYPNGGKQIYVPGINDKELCYSPELEGNKTFAYVSYKQLMPYIKDFYYVDKTDPNSLKSTKRKNRADMDKGIQRFDVTKLHTKHDGKFHYDNNINNNVIDRSGYEIKNPDKYKEILKKNRAKNYANLLQKAYDRLLDIKDSLVSYVNFLDFDRVNSNEANNSGVLDYFVNAKWHYQKLLSDINEINANNELTPAEKEDSLIELFVLNGTGGRYQGSSYEQLLYYLNELEKALSKYKPRYLDW